MKSVLLALMMLQLGPQVGVVSGVVHGANGVPTSGVRVFAIEARESNDADKSSPALVSISVTDNQGRYKLEIAEGRYHIASGSVETPTYSPGTSDITAAHVIRITKGTAIANVDFSTFVPPPRTAFGNPISPPPGSTGVLSGVIRYADGSPAFGLPVTVVAAVSGLGAPNPPLNAAVRFLAGTQASSDLNGRYLISGVSPGSYFITAGFAELPAYYPGTTDVQSALAITTTPTTNLNTLDFTVPRQPTGFHVRGQVTAAGRIPAVGAMVRIQNQSPLVQAATSAGIPSRTFPFSVPVASDGRMEYLNVPPGSYVLEVQLPGIASVLRNIAVTDAHLDGVDIAIPISVFSGRIVSEDGTPLSAPQAFGDAIVTTVRNPNLIMSTIMPISAAGTFGRQLEQDEYRFRLRMLPEGYTVKSITSDGKDLLKETLIVGELAAVNVEIRVEKKDKSDPGEVRLSGKVLDAVSGAPVVATDVVICCRDSSITERFSTPLRSDGSFEFASIPQGKYTAGIQVSAGSPNLFLVNPWIEVGSNGVSGIEIRTTQRFVSVMARTLDEGGRLLNAGPSVSVVFVGTSPRNRVAATSGDDGNWSAVLPAGDIYTATVENLPSGYSLKSTTGRMDPRAIVIGVNFIGGSPPVPVVSITISSP